ncbi:MAG: leucine-rich repeat domain-containing protein [Oscillibacter sp.]|nr:leucine-rich repeat domain-containing protein [Oscillibacter sp.]
MGFYMRRCQIFGGGNSPENADIEKLIAKIAALFGKTPAKFVDEDDAPTKIFDDAPAKIKEPPVNIIQSGSCGENVIYTLDEKGLLTISGYGDMDSYYGGKTPWLNRHQMISAVRIQKGVTSIGSSTFYKCRSLASVTIPDSVTSIGNEAFYGCCRLTGVTIPDSVTSIGNEAFASCNSLINVTVPDNVTSIGLLAFYTCSSLTSITILDGATSIGIGAFMGCDRLTSVTIPDSVIFIGERAFAYCGKLKSVSVPAKATIENDAFPDTTKVIRRE